MSIEFDRAVVIDVRMSRPVADALKREARAQGLSVSKTAELMIRDGLERQQNAAENEREVPK